MAADYTSIYDVVRELQSSCFHGEFLCKLTVVSEKMRLSRHGGPQCHYSTDFYIEPQSYKYRLELYLNGTGTGQDSHVSLHLVTLQGTYDRALIWPPNFMMRISLVNQFGDGHLVNQYGDGHLVNQYGDSHLVNQYGGGHLDYTLCPDAVGNFIQPEWETFIPLDELRQPHSNYVRDDVMFVKVTKLKNMVPTTFNSISRVTCVNQ